MSRPKAVWGVGGLGPPGPEGPRTVVGGRGGLAPLVGDGGQSPPGPEALVQGWGVVWRGEGLGVERAVLGAFLEALTGTLIEKSANK